MKNIKSIKYFVYILAAVFSILFFTKNYILFLPCNIVCTFQNISFPLLHRCDTFKAEFSGENTKPENFSAFGGDICILSDTSFNIFKKNGKKIFDLPHNFSDPAVSFSRLRALGYDLGGKDFKILGKRREIFSGKLENNIISASISERNVYCFITDSDEYASELIVFKKKHRPKYKYSFARFYASAIALSQNGTSAAVCGIRSENAGIKSLIYIFDLNSEEPKFTIECEDNILVSVRFFKDGNIIAIGNKAAVFINGRSGAKKEFSFGDLPVCHVSIDKNSGAAISLSLTGDERNQKIYMLGKSGQITRETETGMKLKSISRRGQKVTALSENKITIYKMFGLTKKDILAPTSAVKVELIDSNGVYVLGKGMFEKIKG
jgi:hypothetical protein